MTFIRALNIHEKSQFQRISTVKLRCVCHKDLQHEVTLSPPDSFVGLQKELKDIFSEYQLVIHLL